MAASVFSKRFNRVWGLLLDLSILAFYYVGAEEGLYSFYGQDKIASANAVLHMLYLFFSYATIGGHQGDGEIQIQTNKFSTCISGFRVDC